MCRNQEEMGWEEISITDLAGVKIGNAQDEDAMTGVTVMMILPSQQILLSL